MSELIESVKSALANGERGSDINKLVSDHYDRILIDLYRGSGAKDSALVAIGGYGRREMSLYSDVDLLLLHKDSDNERAEKLIKEIVYPLWNSNIDITGSTRTIEDTLGAIGEDVRSMTSIIDARFLVGDEGLYNDFKIAIAEYFSKKKHKDAFVIEKVCEHRSRMQRYGDSVFVGEPHVKEGEGGLRSFHTALWLAKIFYGVETLDDMANKGIISSNAIHEWEHSLDFIWRTRHALHFLAKRRQDRLDYDSQHLLAAILFPEKEAESCTVENFMHHYYKYASFIYLASERLIGSVQKRSFIKKIKDRLLSYRLDKDIARRADTIIIGSDGSNPISPQVAIRAWQAAVKRGLKLDHLTKEHMRASSFYWGDLSEDKELTAQFKELIKNIKGVYTAIMEMYETGFLFKLIPEFKKVYHKVEFDAYHLYTVDVHTLFVIREFSRMAESGKYSISEVKRPDLLVLAGLLHDIGKGYERKEKHDVFGARIAREIMTRMDYDEKDIQVVEFLVGSHLILSHIAFCRDTSDPQLTENLAQSVKNTEYLKMLYLLTVADIRATSPEVWNTWKGELLAKLYKMTDRVLAGEGFTAEHIDEIVREKKAELKYAEAAEWIDAMPVGYVVSASSKDIKQHFEVAKMLPEIKLKMSAVQSPEKGYYELTVITRDAPGLFARICGIFSSHRINILEANLNTGKNGDVIDIFKVEAKEPDWQKIESELQKIISDNDVTLEKIFRDIEVSRSKADGLKLKRYRHDPETRIVVDNDVSAYYSVLEVYTSDKIGLLFNIAHWLYKNGYNIGMAKAMTHVGQVVDAFYVTDTDGNKIGSKKEIEKIVEEMTI